MRQPVVVQDGLLVEGLAANVTLVRPLAGVQSQMGFHVPFLAKSLVANEARKWSFSCVKAFMSFHACLRCKFPVAFWTLVLLFDLHLHFL